MRHRGQLARQLSATLRNHLRGSLEEVFADARRAALVGLEVDRVSADRLPEQLPYTLDQILDPDWLPENRHDIRDEPPVNA